MRTTLAIDDDVLEAAKAIASQTRRTVGDVISDLARKALKRPEARRDRNGFPRLPAREGVMVTQAIINTDRGQPQVACVEGEARFVVPRG